MGSVRRLPDTPVSRLAAWNAFSYEPASVSERAPQQTAKEQIIEVTARAFDHFSAGNRSTKSAYEKQLTGELMAHLLPLFARRSENASFALQILLTNYRYYCRQVKEWTLLDATVEVLVKDIGFWPGSYFEEVESIKALVERRALLALIAGPSM